MSDERRQNSTVNLQELERQLREAARARQRAQASADNLTGAQVDRAQNLAQSQPTSQTPQNPASAYQPGLPLSAPQANPAPSSVATSFRPLTQPQATPVPQPPPAMPQANPYFAAQPAATPQAAPRETVSSYAASATPVYEPRRSEFSDHGSDLLKTDRMADLYPPIEPETVGQDQFFSAAAYEEPAQDAYDRFTEDQFPRIEQDERSGGIAKFAVWGAVIAIIGLGAYFAYPLLQNMLMPSNQTAKAPALIKADPTPVKVEPETQPQDTANAPKDIFTKHANENPTAAQISAPAEQPTDVNAAIKAGTASQPDGSKPAIIPLVPGTGEPRPVKTVTVRADGTIIPEKSDPALAAKVTPQGPKVITMPQPSPQLGQSSALPNPVKAEPALPQKPVAESPEFVLEGDIPLPPERVEATQPELNLPLDAGSTPAQPTATPQATAPAQATTPVAGFPGKDFAVQFGAPETEAKGNELKARVEKQFASALSGGTVAVVQGESNGKPVFRVRAIGYSREDANAVCQQVAAAGGQCFVSKNN